MGYLDAGTGVRSGLDISYCRAVAAALGLNPDTDVEYIPASGNGPLRQASLWHYRRANPHHDLDNQP
ncbi:MAG: hypothetical protein CM1200mP21_08670 [Candidatus Poseidoniales archaeon]|nr:MAG: hypothetical protein CM1200mP21_08670 [Candidatus Poseidoniales archaeon]